MIQRLEDERLIGMTALWHAFNPHHTAFVSIGIGEREFWGKGYGTEAMNLVLEFGFGELNLHRVNLVTFEINPRSIRSYEKVGFVHEGNLRGGMLRYRKRLNLVFMVYCGQSGTTAWGPPSRAGVGDLENSSGFL